MAGDDHGAIVVVGGSRSIGLEIARFYAAKGKEVILTGQHVENVDSAVRELRAAGGNVRGLTFDLAEPEGIGAALADVGPVRHLALVAIDRDMNSVPTYNVTGAIRLVTLKLVGFTEVVHALLDRLSARSSIVVFGGQAMFLPYPGSTTVSTVNGGVEGLVRTLVHELKPIRVNCLHPGIVGDSPYWETRKAALDAILTRTPTGKLVTMADIVDATHFLFENPAMNGVNLRVDGGVHAT